MPKMNRFLLAAALVLPLTGVASAAEGGWQESPLNKPTQSISRDAQRALICQTVADWAAYEMTEQIRDDARENNAIDPEGMQMLRQIRMTEALASAAFEKLAPKADHDSMYHEAVKKMKAYLKEDMDGADANTKQLVPVCQQTYSKMAAAGELSAEQVRSARESSKESVARLTEELQADSR